MTENPYKNVEFEKFIEILQSEDQVGHWIEVAEALGVDKDTISDWKKHPRAVDARLKGIARALSGMERVGAKDWHMYLEKLKMLGVYLPKSELSIKGDPVGDVLRAAGFIKGKDDGKTPKASEGPSDREAQV